MQESTPPNGQQEMGMPGSLCSSSGLVDHRAHSPWLAWTHPWACGVHEIEDHVAPQVRRDALCGHEQMLTFCTREQSVRTQLLLLGHCVIQNVYF